MKGCIGGLHSSNMTKILSSQPPIILEKQAIFQYHSDHPFNKPVVPGKFDNVITTFMLDSGSDISVASENLIRKICPSVSFTKLSIPLICFPFDKDPAECKHKPENIPAPIEYFTLVTIELLNFRFRFPIHCHPGSVPIIIIGNDLLSIMNCNINVSLSRITFPLPKKCRPGSKFDQWVQEVSNIIDSKGVAIAQTLRKSSSRNGCIIATHDNNIEDDASMGENESKSIRGIDLNDNEHFIYPTSVYSLEPFSSVQMLCQSRGLTLRTNEYYQIHLINRDPNNRLSTEEGNRHIICHQIEDSDLFYINFTSITGGQLHINRPCAVIKRCSMGHVAELSAYLNEQNKSNPQNIYPEVSKFKATPFFDELPLPNKDGKLPAIRDYSEAEKEEVTKEIDKWIMTEGEKRFMTPKPKVKLPIDATEKIPVRHALLSKMLSLLPDGVWYQEDESRLPGVPMTDMAVRIKLNSQVPIASKMKRMSPEECQLAREYCKKEVALGLYEACQSEWCSNSLFAPKPDGSLRMCIDYRKINEQTIKDKYPLPRLENIVANIAGKPFISLVDMKLGFQNLFIHPEDRKYLAFHSPLGLLQPIRLPFGWTNGPPVAQRESDRTLDDWFWFFLVYLDDIAGGDSENQRRHDMILTTILSIFHKRGYTFHALKAQLLARRLHLMGLSVNGEGVQPDPAKGIFDILLQRKHRSLNDLQKTAGALVWHKMFVPNFSYGIRNLLQLLKEENRLNPALNWDEECQKAILFVKDAVEKIPTLHHNEVGSEKQIFVTCGTEAFAVSIFQITKKGERQVLEYWSRKWTLNVTNYSRVDQYALAVREVVKHARPVLFSSSSITFFINDQSFVALANNIENWTTRMKRFLAHTIEFSPKFKLLPSKYQQDLELLNKPIPSQDIQPQPIVDRKAILKKHFQEEDESKLDRIPIVHTDGGCVTLKDKSIRVGAVGVYWGPSSTFNVSKLAEHKPFTNQRAELEAILVAVLQAIERKLTRLIILSDSSYAVNCIRQASTSWNLSKVIHGDGYVLTDAKGQSPKNVDLFLLILVAIKNHPELIIYWEHIRRCYNEEADALVNLAYPKAVALVKIAAVETRSMKVRRDEELSDANKVGSEAIQEAQAKASLNSSGLDDEDDDDLIVFIDYEDQGESDYEDDSLQLAHYENEINESERDKLIEQLTRSPEFSPDEVEHFTDCVELEELPPVRSKHQMPAWSKDIIYHHSSPPSEPIIAVYRFDAPQLMEFSKLMTVLPQAQSDDPSLSGIVQALKEPNSASISATVDKKLRAYSLWKPSNLLTITLSDCCIRMVVPAALQTPVMELFHKSPVMGGHPGAKATAMHIKRYFYWKSMVRHIQSYCANCSACIITRSQRGKVPGLLTNLPFPKGPFYRIHADTIKGLAPSKGYRYILLVMDSFTKFIFTHPLRTMHPQAVIEGLILIFTRFGQPHTFTADNGSEFHCAEVTSFLQLWGVQWFFPSPYNPQANGQAEAGVKIISRRLRSTLAEMQLSNPIKFAENKWSTILPYITMSYNVCPNEMTGFAPYELVFGRMPHLPMNNSSDRLDSIEKLQTKPYDYLREVKNALKEAFALVEVKIKQSKEKSKEYFDKNRPPLHLKPGDFTFVTWPYNQKPKKLQPKGYGPFKITKVSHHPDTGDVVSVECDIAPSDSVEPKLKVFPRSRLRPIDALLPSVDWDQLLSSALNPSETSLAQKDESHSDIIESSQSTRASEFSFGNATEEMIELEYFNPVTEICAVCSLLMIR